MYRILTATVLTTALLGTAAFAQQPSSPEEERYLGRTHVRIDHEAMRNMTREERQAAMQAYKAARESEARAAGIKVSSDRQFVRLDPPRHTLRDGSNPEKLLVPGSNITYDSGMVIGSGGVASQMVGNRFDSALNPAGTMCCFPVEASGSVTMITFDMVNTFFSSAVWSLYSDIMGTTAMQVTSMGRPVVPGLNTLSVMSPTTANAYMNGSFLAGIWQFTPMSTALGVDTNSAGSQGFHGISLNDGAVGTMLTAFTTGGGMSANAVFRVSGNVATPVELMSFSVQ